MSLTLMLPLMLAQVGGFDLNNPYASALPREIVEKKADQDRKRREEAAMNSVALPAARSNTGCMGAVEANPEKSAQLARDAMKDAIGRERVRAGLCLGVALSDLGQWDDAREAFVAARDAAEVDDHASRARLGEMAGNAALAAGQPGQALGVLSPAASDADAAGDPEMTAAIALDRARALVAVNQPDEAAEALAKARTAQPDNAQAWLLSATLSRRQNKLAVAQTQIEKAAELAPRDPEIGLEAGVIAVLSGNDAAARRSWNSVLATAPESDSAATAKQYIAQLGLETKPKP
ncbi:tetratricopeptide repeat protein [Novosphingobium album (ex Hu et al. 2023)]|uniref:Tetratricopeptide repeat protein n=1 Tax=Novosphingobium album (ex Hu et al. 2023) TaxID=2930093 RepID=A0ABT0B642_9SPHN|nr:tetratricopeptide repeat protein [Novosphingobium album (ex Hu et al. 2023)]MCJ2180473.1 tetratricopeptide repeat protein [Novosphingobium album (ex Hu et al. 2023)]